MKLLLTSLGLRTKQIQQKLIENLPTTADETVIQFIWSDPIREYHHEIIKKEKETMNKLGIQEKNINVTRLHENPIQKISKNYLIYMGGGNQYRYLKRLYETNLYSKIRDYVEQDRLYIGLSAGAMIMCPDIDLEWSVEVNDVDLLDLSGFNYVDFYILPHWGGDRFNDPRIIEEFEKQGKRLIPIRDNEAIYVEDQKLTII
jgi:dipeptidase E